MKEDLKLYAGIAIKSGLKWLFVACSGWILTLVFLIIVLIQQHGTGHGKMVVFFSQLASANWAALVVLLASPLFFFLYFVLANKIAIQTLIYNLWTKKGMDLIRPALSTALKRITSNVNWSKNLSDEAMLRARLLEASRRDKTISTNTKRVVTFSLKRIKLDDVDLQNEKLSLYDVLLDKLLQYFSTFAEPDFLLFWVLLILQILLFSAAQYLHQI